MQAEISMMTFLNKLPKSTTELARVKKLIPMNPRLKVADGLYDQCNWVRDAITSKIKLHLFKKWSSKRNLFALHGNIWNFDLG